MLALETHPSDGLLLLRQNNLSSIENIRDDALIRLGLSVGMRVSEVESIRDQPTKAVPLLMRV